MVPVQTELCTVSQSRWFLERSILLARNIGYLSVYWKYTNNPLVTFHWHPGWPPGTLQWPLLIPWRPLPDPWWPMPEPTVTLDWVLTPWWPSTGQFLNTFLTPFGPLLTHPEHPYSWPQFSIFYCKCITE